MQISWLLTRNIRWMRFHYVPSPLLTSSTVPHFNINEPSGSINIQRVSIRNLSHSSIVHINILFQSIVNVSITGHLPGLMSNNLRFDLMCVYSNINWHPAALMTDEFLGRSLELLQRIFNLNWCTNFKSFIHSSAKDRSVNRTLMPLNLIQVDLFTFVMQIQPVKESKFFDHLGIRITFAWSWVKKPSKTKQNNQIMARWWTTHRLRHG